MNSKEIILLGLKDRVAAISRLDGHVFWTTDLSGRMSAGFVSISSDESRVFAYCGGHLYCLDLTTGRILWDNELRGFGYGLASLSIPGGPSTSDAASAQHATEQTAAVAAATAGT